jgi:hypothetical protein
VVQAVVVVMPLARVMQPLVQELLIKVTLEELHLVVKQTQAVAVELVQLVLFLMAEMVFKLLRLQPLLALELQVIMPVVVVE